MNYTFRKATLSDVPKMVEITNSAYRGDPTLKTWTSEGHLIKGARITPPRLAEYMNEENAWFVLMLINDEVLASVYLRRESRDSLYLGIFAVNPKSQAGGLGKALLTHIAETARSENYKQMRLTVIELRPELIAYYERRGFVRTGKLEPFPHSDCSEGTPVDPDLQVVEMIKKL